MDAGDEKADKRHKDYVKKLQAGYGLEGQCLDVADEVICHLLFSVIDVATSKSNTSVEAKYLARKGITPKRARWRKRWQRCARAPMPGKRVQVCTEGPQGRLAPLWQLPASRPSCGQRALDEKKTASETGARRQQRRSRRARRELLQMRTMTKMTKMRT